MTNVGRYWCICIPYMCFDLHVCYICMINLGQEKPMKEVGTCPSPVTAAVIGHLVSAQWSSDVAHAEEGRDDLSVGLGRVGMLECETVWQWRQQRQQQRFDVEMSLRQIQPPSSLPEGRTKGKDGGREHWGGNRNQATWLHSVGCRWWRLLFSRDAKQYRNVPSNQSNIII